MERRLQIGDCLYLENSNLFFDILDIKEDENWVRVKVTDVSTCYEHEEEWDDLHNVYYGLENGEYKLYPKNVKQEDTFGTLPFVLTNTFPSEDYCFFDEPKGYGKYKNSGKPRMKRRK